MISSALKSDIHDLILKSHKQWLLDVCRTLDTVPDRTQSSELIEMFPLTNNNDAAHCLSGIVRAVDGKMSWKALGITVDLCVSMFFYWQQQQCIDLLWSGPLPGSQILARRIDQVFYDLISSSRREILLVTFAAYKIQKLIDCLGKGLDRGVRVRLVLEFEQTSMGQLSTDTLSAFPDSIRRRSEIYYWPLDQRQCNLSGKPGKLHAKVAVIDDQAILSSANLTDDAFNRNLELGVLVSHSETLTRIRGHFDALCACGTLRLWEF